MTDNRTTELLRKLLDERGLSCQTHYLHVSWRVGSKLYDAVDNLDGTLTVDNLTPEQAVAATLGRPKAKAHPYGYEPDTGAFDCTRCECGCINDISATYCNDCGGEIEIDMYAEKEIYHIPCHLVFAEKHDDGSLEFGGKRYVAATLGNSRAERTCKQEERGWGTEGDHARVWLTCGHDCMVPTVQDLPNYCPSCGCKVVS